jgi:hypothetical protein
MCWLQGRLFRLERQAELPFVLRDENDIDMTSALPGAAGAVQGKTKIL